LFSVEVVDVLADSHGEASSTLPYKAHFADLMAGVRFRENPQKTPKPFGIHFAVVRIVHSADTFEDGATRISCAQRLTVPAR
jgi:hypothetical protein